MSGSGSLQGPDSAQALVNAVSSQNVDDSFVTYTFTIMPPAAFIRPIADHAPGDRFTIGGTTNLAAGDNLMVEITSSSFRPTQKSAAGGFSGSGGMVTVVPGSGGYNQWSFDVDASSFQPDEYIVKVSGVTVDVTASTTFNIVEHLPATAMPQIPSSPAVTETTLPPETTPLPRTTTSPQAPVWIGITLAACSLAILAKQGGR
jgi:hypothetical protein